VIWIAAQTVAAEMIKLIICSHIGNQQLPDEPVDRLMLAIPTQPPVS